LAKSGYVAKEYSYKLVKGGYKTKEYSYVSCNGSLHNGPQLVDWEWEVICAIRWTNIKHLESLH